jgi:hypothetical protein
LLNECRGSKLVILTEPWDGPTNATIQYSDLTPGEKELVDPAIADGEYVDCYPDRVPEPTQQFVARVLEAAVDTTAYLRRGETSYALTVQLSDKVYSFIPESETTHVDE